MVDMQNYISRLEFSEVIRGLRDGIEIHRGSIDCKIIICLNGDNDESEALEMIEQSKKHQDIIVAIGMATSQESLPVKKFERAFLLAKDYGFKTCSHFWDANCCSQIKQGLEQCQLDRIDHGMSVLDDLSLLQECIKKRVPFTFCP
jgi:adenine deaminase